MTRKFAPHKLIGLMILVLSFGCGWLMMDIQTFLQSPLNLPATDNARPGGVDPQTNSLGRSFDLHPRDPGMLQFVFDKLAILYPLFGIPKQ